MYIELPEHDKLAITTFVRLALNWGYAVSVSDGDSAWTEPETHYPNIVEFMGEMDSDQVAIHRGGERAGWFLFVYGNGPGETIADHSANAECEALHAAWMEEVGAE